MNTGYFVSKQCIDNLGCEETAVGDDGNAQFSLVGYFKHTYKITIKQWLAFTLELDVFKLRVKMEDFFERLQSQVALGHFPAGAKTTREVAAGGGFDLCVANSQ